MFFFSDKISDAKRFVQNIATPLRSSTYQTYRVAKVVGCATWLVKEMLKDFSLFKCPAGTEPKRWKFFEENMELLNRGLSHELAMCTFVEDNGFGFVKRFESHDRVPSEYRKRAEKIAGEFKREQQAAKKVKSEDGPK